MTEQPKPITSELTKAVLSRNTLPPSSMPQTREEIVKYLEEAQPQGCGLEGVGGRPTDCPNNPWKYPENYRPEICRQCPGNPQISRVAENPLPPLYIKLKQEV